MFSTYQITYYSLQLCASYSEQPFDIIAMGGLTLFQETTSHQHSDNILYYVQEVLYVQEVGTRPKILNWTILPDWIHVT